MPVNVDVPTQLEVTGNCPRRCREPGVGKLEVGDTVAHIVPITLSDLAEPLEDKIMNVHRAPRDVLT